MAYNNPKSNFHFLRRPRCVGLPYAYTAALGLKPGRYKILSEAVADMLGPYPTVIGYVVAYKGRLLRAWMS